MTAAAPGASGRGRVAAVILTVVLAGSSAAGLSCAGRGAEPASGPGGAVTAQSSGPSTSSGPSPSSGCGETPGSAVAVTSQAGTTDEVLTSGGVDRRYQLILPDGYDGRTPLPLLLGLHSLTVDYHVVAGMAGFGDMAAGYDFIAVAPSGLLGPSGQPYWNAVGTADNGDVVFLSDLVDHLERSLCVDRSRVFSLGMSNGAQMSSLIACRLPGRIAAIAPVAGVEYGEPCGGPPVGVIAFHGYEDPIVPYEGGGLDSVTIADVNLYHGRLPSGATRPGGVDASMARWAAHNRCDPNPVEERISPEVRKRTWSGCDAPTVLYVVDNGGHAWPGRPQPAMEAAYGHATTDIDATALMFRLFFDRVT